MNTIPEFLSSSKAFKHQYIGGLVRLMCSFSDPSSRVLVAACDSYHPDWCYFSAEELEKNFRWSLRQYHILCGFDPKTEMSSEDDAIFKAVLTSPASCYLEPAEKRKVGEFSVVYSPIRTLRPMGACKKMKSRQVEYDPVKEALFTKEYIQKERIWNGELSGVVSAFFYNKFPNLLGHCLVVPWPERRLFQEMTRELHDWTWEIAGLIGDRIPGISFGFNSIGGRATQKQFHLQGSIEEKAFPVTSDVWTHNGGKRDYPGTPLVAVNKEEAWGHVAACLADDRLAYNLLYTPSKLYTFPDQIQGTIPDPWWSSGNGFGDKAGRIITTSRDAFKSVTETMIIEAFESWSKSVR